MQVINMGGDVWGHLLAVGRFGEFFGNAVKSERGWAKIKTTEWWYHNTDSRAAQFENSFKEHWYKSLPLEPRVRLTLFGFCNLPCLLFHLVLCWFVSPGPGETKSFETFMWQRVIYSSLTKTNCPHWAPETSFCFNTGIILHQVCCMPGKIYILLSNSGPQNWIGMQDPL